MFIAPCTVASAVRLLAMMALFGPAASTSWAAGGLFGIDHQLNVDDRGPWKRSNQLLLEHGVVLAVIGGALWEGDGSRLGHTLWQSVDSLVVGSVSAEGLKYAFSRARPSQTTDPNQWFQGSGHKSFPSGEVMAVTTAVTPIVLEYGRDQPAVWALELLPVYDAVARVKARGHWQSDVVASLALGTVIGAYAHGRPSSVMVEVLPHRLSVGFHRTF